MVVPVARYSSGEISWHVPGTGKTSAATAATAATALGGVVPVAIVLVFPTITYYILPGTY